MCNVHLSVFTIWSKYFGSRHIWILIHLSMIVIHNTRHFPELRLRSDESFGNISWKRWKQRNLNKEWFSTSLRYRLKFARAKKVGGPPKASPGKIFNLESWGSWCDWLKKRRVSSIKCGFFRKSEAESSFLSFWRQNWTKRAAHCIDNKNSSNHRVQFFFQ